MSTGRKLFGTDGVRGKANVYPMTAEMAMKIGISAGAQFTRGKYRHKVVIGKDTRISGYMLESALVAGFTSAGMDVFLLGPTPTPAVAMLTQSMRADLGVMISASHNPFYDNGIKIFGPDGCKLSDEQELEIEKRIEEGLDSYYVTDEKVGRAQRLDDALGRYTEFVKRTFPHGQTLEGLKIVVDCANGAAYKVAPTVLRELGAEVVTVGVEPNGVNINRYCGATDTEFMCQEVVKHCADVGIALDGDADRLIVCDEKGNMVDGDQILALIGGTWHKEGKLKNGAVVATIMSNLGLEKYLESIGSKLIRTQVGDRYVVEKMTECGYNVGGEQSGHVVLSDYATTGDGLLSALQVLSCLVEAQRPLSEVAHVFEPMPQILKNVRFADRASAEETMNNEIIISAIKATEEKLAKNGRLVIRKSGTEPVIRVMAEGEDATVVDATVNDLVTEIKKVAGL